MHRSVPGQLAALTVAPGRPRPGSRRRPHARHDHPHRQRRLRSPQRPSALLFINEGAGRHERHLHQLREIVLAAAEAIPDGRADGGRAPTEAPVVTPPPTSIAPAATDPAGQPSAGPPARRHRRLGFLVAVRRLATTRMADRPDLSSDPGGPQRREPLPVCCPCPGPGGRRDASYQRLGPLGGPRTRAVTSGGSVRSLRCTVVLSSTRQAESPICVRARRSVAWLPGASGGRLRVRGSALFRRPGTGPNDGKASRSRLV